MVNRVLFIIVFITNPQVGVRMKVGLKPVGEFLSRVSSLSAWGEEGLRTHSQEAVDRLQEVCRFVTNWCEYGADIYHIADKGVVHERLNDARSDLIRMRQLDDSPIRGLNVWKTEHVDPYLTCVPDVDASAGMKLFLDKVLPLISGVVDKSVESESVRVGVAYETSTKFARGEAEPAEVAKLNMTHLNNDIQVLANAAKDQAKGGFTFIGRVATVATNGAKLKLNSPTADMEGSDLDAVASVVILLGRTSRSLLTQVAAAKSSPGGTWSLDTPISKPTSDVQAVRDFIQNTERATDATWADAIATVTTRLNSVCPRQHVLENSNLLNQSDLQKMVRDNPDRAEILPNIENLTAHLKAVKRVQADGAKQMVGPRLRDIFADAKNAAKNGKIAVGLNFLLAETPDAKNLQKKGQDRDDWIGSIMSKLKLKGVELPQYALHYLVEMRRLAAQERRRR